MPTKYFMNGGSNSNWSSDSNWSTTASSGPNNTTHAVNGDAVILDSGSPDCVIDTASACTSINCTGYTNTLTFNGTLTAAGAVTFASSMAAMAGSSDLICTTTATLTSGGKTLPGGLQLQGTSQTFTLSGAWTLNGALTFNGTTGATLNSSTLSCAGLSVGTGTLQGTTAITLTGATWSGAGTLKNNLAFAGNSTVSGTVNYYSGTISYSSGTVTVTGSTLLLASSATMTTNGMSWNNVQLSTSTTLTLNSLLTVNGTMTLSISGSLGFAGSAGWNVAGTLALAGAPGATRTYTLQSGNTYTVSGTVNFSGPTSSNRIKLVASTPGSKAYLNIQSDALLPFVDPTDIDSSGGKIVYTYKGTITTSVNWVAGTLTLPAASNVKTGSGTYGYSDAPITPTGSAGGILRPVGMTGGMV